MPYYRPPADDERRSEAARLLGLAASATPSEVKRAYRRLALVYHPDRHPAAAAELKELAAQKFAAIASAYKLLAETCKAPILYGLSTDVSMISTVRGDDIVRCFSCFARCRLPEARDHETARCPRCQALLLLDCDMAEVFLRVLKERGS